MIICGKEKIRLLWLLRIGSPLSALVGALLAYLVWRIGSYGWMSVDVVILIGNCAMSYVAWFVFELPPQKDPG